MFRNQAHGRKRGARKDEEQTRIRRSLIQRGRMTADELSAVLKIEVGTVKKCLEELRKIGAAKNTPHGWVFLAESRRLPMIGYMVPGIGERQDCGRYKACLDAFLGARLTSSTGKVGCFDIEGKCAADCACGGDRRCPSCHGTRCTHHEPVAEAKATDYMHGTGHGALIYCDTE